MPRKWTRLTFTKLPGKECCARSRLSAPRRISSSRMPCPCGRRTETFAFLTAPSFMAMRGRCHCRRVDSGQGGARRAHGKTRPRVSAIRPRPEQRLRHPRSPLCARPLRPVLRTPQDLPAGEGLLAAAIPTSVTGLICGAAEDAGMIGERPPSIKFPCSCSILRSGAILPAELPVSSRTSWLPY